MKIVFEIGLFLNDNIHDPFIQFHSLTWHIPFFNSYAQKMKRTPLRYRSTGDLAISVPVDQPSIICRSASFPSWPPSPLATTVRILIILLSKECSFNDTFWIMDNWNEPREAYMRRYQASKDRWLPYSITHHMTDILITTATGSDWNLIFIDKNFSFSHHLS